MSASFRYSHLAAVVVLALASHAGSVSAQDRPPTAGPQLSGGSELGWSSGGHLPFSSLDMTVLKAGDRYIMYYIGRDSDGRERPGRAFSHDLINWTQDAPGFCPSAGDICLRGDTFYFDHLEVLPLPDGRFRAYRKNPRAGGELTLVSLISSDGLSWREEAGQRLSHDPGSIWERSDFTFIDQTFARLPDGRVRMYYQGGLLGGSPDTPPEYGYCVGRGVCLVILSAISSDGGVTFVREPGVRINPREIGPQSPDGHFSARGMDVVAIDEGPGKQGFRMYTSSFFDSLVTYFSPDGLTFELEGQVPVLGSDVETAVMPDGRLWLVSNLQGEPRYPLGCAAGCDFDGNQPQWDIGTMTVYGPQPATVTVGPWDDARKTATITVAGAAPAESAFKVLLIDSWCGVRLRGEAHRCAFQPQYYNFSTGRGVSASEVVVTYNGPADPPDQTRDNKLLFRVDVGDTNIVGVVYCMNNYQWTQFCAHRR